MLERELYRHFRFVENTKNILYSNPIHIKGLFAYRDKRKLYDLNNKNVLYLMRNAFLAQISS